MSKTSIISLIALMDAYRGEIWQHHTTRSDLYNAAMAELSALLAEADIAAAHGRLAGLKEAMDICDGPAIDPRDIYRACAARIAEIEGTSK